MNERDEMHNYFYNFVADMVMKGNWLTFKKLSFPDCTMIAYDR